MHASWNMLWSSDRVFGSFLLSSNEWVLSLGSIMQHNVDLCYLAMFFKVLLGICINDHW